MCSSDLFLDGDADSEMRNAMQEVAGAVERIDNPPGLVLVPFDHTGFFHHESPIRPCGEKFVVDGAFGDPIRLRYEVCRPLMADLKVLDLAKVATQAATRRATCLLQYADDTR